MAQRHALGQAVDDGRIGFQFHAEPQAIQEYARDTAAFARHAGFLFHQ